MQRIKYRRTEREVQLTGYSGRSTGVVELVTFDRTQRLRRAWLGLGAWWAAALAAVFIPVAHFALVPGFLAFGVYSFVRRSRTDVVAVELAGTCPDCAAEQSFDLPSTWSDTVDVACDQCHRSIRVTPLPPE